MKARVEVSRCLIVWTAEPYWDWQIYIHRSPHIHLASDQEFITEQQAQKDAEKWFKKFGFEKWEG